MSIARPSAEPASASPRSERKLGAWIRVCAVLVIGLLLVLKTLNYIAPDTVSIRGAKSVYVNTRGHVEAFIRDTPYFHHCQSGFTLTNIPGGWVCASSASPPTIYSEIYRSYPSGPSGKNYVYESTAAGSMQVAKDLLRGVVDVPRYRPVKLKTGSIWNEDPYKAVYWRMNYYALRPEQSLLAAYISTGRADYADRVDELYLTASSRAKRPPSSHGVMTMPVAFRSMGLVNLWWRLRQYHQLSEQQSTAVLRQLEKTGNFLADINHYEPAYNHGTNEAAALFELALDFPTLPHAHEWLQISRARLAHSMDDLVDGDGALIENSPCCRSTRLTSTRGISNFSPASGTRSRLISIGALPR